MSLKAFKNQFLFALRQRGAAISFCVLLALALWSFTGNVLEFQGTDVIEMYHPACLLTLSAGRAYYNGNYAILLVQIYPVLVVCPAGFLLVSEKHRKEDALLVSRIGAVPYYITTALSAFFVTMFVFTVPFFIELVLNCISFPTDATGIFANDGNKYSEIYKETIQNYLFPDLHSWNCYVYAIVCILLFGVFSGVLGMFTVALSAIWNVSYKVLLFLPVFVLLNISVYLSAYVSLPVSTRWYDYVFLFNDRAKQPWLLVAFLLVLCAVSAVCVWYQSRRDQL